MRLDATTARFPFPKGGYESFYLTAHHPDEPLAIWIRCTVTQAPGGEPVGRRWVTLFEPGGPTAIRTTGDLSTLGAWIRVGDAAFLDGVCGGTAGDAVWDLRFAAREQPLLYLPSERMYAGGFPKTKPVSLAPRARFDGSLRIGSRTIEVRGWEGMIGHNWGREHAARWVWLHGLFEKESWLDVVCARVRLGPFTTPWIANGAMSLHGTRHRLGGPFSRTRVDASATGVSLRARGDGVRVFAQASASPEAFVRWDYAHPRGGSSDVRNCSIATLDVSCVRGGSSSEPIRFRTEAAAYELGVDA